MRTTDLGFTTTKNHHRSGPRQRSTAQHSELHLPGNPPVKLDSQDLLQIGDKEFYFLLPVRSILGGPNCPSHGALWELSYHGGHNGEWEELEKEYYEEDDGDDDNNGIGGSSGKKVRREGFDGYSYGAGGSGGKG